MPEAIELDELHGPAASHPDRQARRMRTVIVGAGAAGTQTALELRQRGFDGELTIVGDEIEEPYDRPPLSKEYLKGAATRESLGLLSRRIAESRGISLRLGHRAVAIRRAEQEVVLDDGSSVPYDRLVLATGSHNRDLQVPGADLPGVWSLRRLSDAEGLRAGLDAASDVVIVGGGFIGLEVAAAARARGARVTVVEFLPRVMARVLSPEMSQYFAQKHERNGVRILTGVGVTAVLRHPDGVAAGVALSDGSEIPADIVVIGVGVLPASELAADAGIETRDGIVVDLQLRTSDPHVYALGDAARFDCVISGRALRLESIQNAADQARFIAAHLAAESRNQRAESETYEALPWFWSEQYDAKLQIAGVAEQDAIAVLRGDPATGSFSVGRFSAERRLVAVESVNQVRDHLAARKILVAPVARRTRITPETFADPGVALKSLLDA